MRTIYVAGPESITVAYGTLLAPAAPVRGRHRRARQVGTWRKHVAYGMGTLAALLVFFYALGVHTQQVQAETSPAPTYAACQEEDASTPGQAFPCMWDASTQGNGQGESYVLTAPVCSTYEVAAADAAHAHGYTLSLACDDLESLIG